MLSKPAKLRPHPAAHFPATTAHLAAGVAVLSPARLPGLGVLPLLRLRAH